MEIILKPTGIVKSSIKAPSLKADHKDINPAKAKEEMKQQHRELKEHISQIIIDKKFEEILEGIEEFSHILVLYWPHLVPEKSRELLKVHPMGRKDLPQKGIYATCSPARPNPILVTAVKLLSRKDNVLEVKGFEAVDGSPVIDIKPYVSHYYSPEDVTVSGWMQDLTEELETEEIENNC
ncbi:tRNA (N6-threonylcarbamoyladenosine(37)-N6)-methyltransferase TrmO [Desulfobacula phenolica]|uniref:tRNA-Thr(GGU) m(6)t(6)A37 methyltransferase TsaA n=1 Tax=Desulfobacula phenolica TaxID=90732 RepID=A0A1H2ITA2_9BACT|nr:tRNA (N6-threonylcarbamoyladenosine(37)-N6)-methyltransferase TrmO [Desulfobacula phenolica]SDU47241.1 tRNA-Thr(GGU) m(6)t(6)A37 methyltransferase TsaA [Desulfobacula phenolica]